MGKKIIRDTLFCPHCGSMRAKRNGERCLCKNCGKTFKESDNALPRMLEEGSQIIIKVVDNNGKRINNK